MKSILLCEGQTDAILIGYYLQKKGWKVYRNAAKVDEAVDGVFAMPIRNDSDIATWFRRGEHYTVVWGVGGESRFESAIAEMMGINRRVAEEEGFQKTILLIDRDQTDSDETKLRLLKGYFQNADVSIDLENRVWKSLEYENILHEVVTVEAVALVIPFDRNGALETFLLQTLAQADPHDKVIVDAVTDLIQNLKTEKYLQTDRLKVKAEFAAALALMYPTRVFEPINKMLVSIPWEEYDTFQTAFQVLDEL